MAVDARPYRECPAVKPAHPPRHAHHAPRHAEPRSLRRPGAAIAWVGVLALAGFVVTPEPAAPAAPLSPRAAAATMAPASVVDEPHPRWLPGASTPPVAPAPPPVGARWGTDIGWPQCGDPLPRVSLDFTVIQVTSGRPRTVSPCLAEQVAWAGSVRSAVNAYVVPASPSAADLAAADRAGTCEGRRSCQLRAAGAADAAHALAGAEAAGLSAHGWWLDVEDVPERTLWGTDTAANAQVLMGWRDELRRAGKAVGVYSTHGYWRQVVGHWEADLPQWSAVGLAGVAAAGRACGRPFTSGPVLLAQWLTGPLDGNVLCAGHDRLATAFFGPFPRTRTAGVPALLVIPVPHPDIEAAQRAQAAREAAQEEKDREAAAAAAARAKARSRTTSTAPPAPVPARPSPATPRPAPPVEPAPVPAPSQPAPSPSPSPASTPPPAADQRSATGT